MADFLPAVTKTIAREGGATITENPADPGGLTKYGISQRAYPSLDIRALTEAQAQAIYKRDYWDAIKGDAIPSQAVAEAIFDTCVNMGVGTGIRLAQTVVGTPPDGKIGPKTLAALTAMDERLFFARFALAKIRRYTDICQKTPSQRVFLLGWVVRALET